MQNSKPKQNVLAGQSLLEIHPSRPEIKIIRNIAISNIAKLANKIRNREYRKYSKLRRTYCSQGNQGLPQGIQFVLYILVVRRREGLFPIYSKQSYQNFPLLSIESNILGIQECDLKSGKMECFSHLQPIRNRLVL